MDCKFFLTNKDLFNKNGIDIAMMFHKKSWVHIWIQTGYQPEALVLPDFISGIVGKDFPVI